MCYGGGSILLDISLGVTVYYGRGSVLSDISLDVTVCYGKVVSCWVLVSGTKH